MYRRHTIAVVVPSYNEEGFVGDVIETVPSFVDRIYPVDDCSADRTWEEIRKSALRVNRASSRPDETPPPLTDGGHTARVLPLRHDRNRGVGAAIKTGYRQAMADDIDIVAVMNGDGQMDPTQLHRLLDPIIEGDAAYAKGNRLSSRDHWSDMSRFRLFGNLLLTALTRIASGYWQMADPQNGYTAIRTDALEALDLDAVYEQYGFLNDMLIRLNAHDRAIADVEMPAVYGDESSSIRYRSFVPRLSWLLVWRFLWRLRTRYKSGDRHTTISYGAGIVGVVLTGVFLLTGVVGAQSLSPWSVLGFFLLCLVLLLTGAGLEHRRSRVLRVSAGK